MSGSAQQVQLSYAVPRRLNLLRCTQHVLVRLALACWIVPLVLGVSVFVIWLFRRSDGLEDLGFFVLVFGTAAAGLGVIFVICFAITNWRKSDNPLEATLLPAILLLVLIGLNFAAASAVMKAVNWVEENYPTPEMIAQQHDAG